MTLRRRSEDESRGPAAVAADATPTKEEPLGMRGVEARAFLRDLRTHLISARQAARSQYSDEIRRGGRR
jgi:hypothetical protein